MESIKLRKRRLRNGNVGLYLDYLDAEGKRVHESLGLYLVPENTEGAKETNRNALAQAMAIKSKRILGIEEAVQDESTPDQGMELLDFIKLFLKTKKEEKEARGKDPTQYDMTARVIRKYLEARNAEHITLAQVNTKLARDFISYLQNEYKTNKTKTPSLIKQQSQRHYQQQFVSMLNYAVRQGYLRQNPFKALEKRELIASPESNREYLTVDEVKAFMNAQTNAPEARDAFVFACFTGLRYSDVKALTWGQIKSGVGGRYVALKMQKTGRQVFIPLNKSAFNALPKNDRMMPDTPVFSLPWLGAINSALKIIARNNGINKNVSFHTARHTFATLSLSAGVDIATVSSILGHTSIKTTQIYAEVVMQSKITAINRMKRLM